MKPEDQAWQKLVSTARQVRDERDTAAPYGFATRVAALAMSAQRRPEGLSFERFSWRALIVAGLLAVGGVATNYASPGTAAAEEETLLDESAVTVVFDVS